jgi:hypothetical protein
MKPARPIPTFDMDHQSRRHFDAHMQQWPTTDPVAAMADIKRLLLAGQAWLWPEPSHPLTPYQFELPLMEVAP